MDFLAKLLELYEREPHLALLNLNSENSDYCQYSTDNKNCYLIFGSDWNEECYYGYWVNHCQNCIDCAYIYKCEICYDCIDCERCYNGQNLQDCKNCYDCSMCFNCVGCHDCFGCVNLRQKEFHIFNKKYSEKEYHQKIAQLKTSSPAQIQTLFEAEKIKSPHVFAHVLKTESCTGDYIYNSKNCYQSFDIQELEDGLYAYNVYQCKDIYDSSYIGTGCEINYECTCSFSNQNCFFSNQNTHSYNLEYCFLCFNCHDCFGCVSLKNKAFHILNQPYSEKEYRQKIAKIKAELKKHGQYSQFHFPSPYRYEDTTAAIYYPAKS